MKGLLQTFKARGGTNEYNLVIKNINWREEILSFSLGRNEAKKLISNNISFSLGRNEAKKLISNNILGVAIVCKFIPPFVDEENNFYSLEYLVFSDFPKLLKKYIIANAQKIVIYNIKNGKIYSESSISDTPYTEEDDDDDVQD